MRERKGSERRRLLVGLLLPIVVIVIAIIAHRVLWGGGRDRLVVYCAHDSVYSEKVLRAFEQQTGISLAIKFDTEATKSLGLVELLAREKDNPRCDVFWNNELLGTMDLQQKGVLHPYKGEGFARIPGNFKDPDGHWVGFGARLRVYIVNTDNMAATDEAVQSRLAGDLSRVAIAKPLYGTTLTHYSVLWDAMGGGALKAWHRETRARGLREVRGNAQVKKLVAEGVCDLGFTDTDDFFVAKDDGKPVAALPVRLQDGSVICIPNTVGIIKGTRRLEDAQRLADYLLSEESELALARSRSRQVPLGPTPADGIPEEVRELTEWAAAGAPLASLGPARAACIEWLKQEYVQ